MKLVGVPVFQGSSQMRGPWLKMILTAEKLEDALREYTRAKDLGIERAAQCIRNVGIFSNPVSEVQSRRN